MGRGPTDPRRYEINWIDNILIFYIYYMNLCFTYSCVQIFGPMFDEYLISFRPELGLLAISE